MVWRKDKTVNFKKRSKWKNRHPGYSREYLEKSIEQYKRDGGKITMLEGKTEDPRFTKESADGFSTGFIGDGLVYVSYNPKNNIF